MDPSWPGAVDMSRASRGLENHFNVRLLQKLVSRIFPPQYRQRDCAKRSSSVRISHVWDLSTDILHLDCSSCTNRSTCFD